MLPVESYPVLDEKMTSTNIAVLLCCMRIAPPLCSSSHTSLHFRLFSLCSFSVFPLSDPAHKHPPLQQPVGPLPQGPIDISNFSMQ